jgi:hypothetical protein
MQRGQIAARLAALTVMGALAVGVVGVASAGSFGTDDTTTLAGTGGMSQEQVQSPRPSGVIVPACKGRGCVRGAGQVVHG